MKSEPTKSQANGSKSKVKKGAAEDTSLSKKLRDKIDGETSNAGPSHSSAGVQRRNGPGSILHYIYKSSLGQSLRSQMRQCLQEPFVRSLSSYHFHGASSPFDRRITCLEWHPTHPTTVAAASKGGDIFLWDFEKSETKSFTRGMGAGYSVTDMKFNLLNPSQLFTSSMGGTTELQDFSGTTLTVFTYTDSLKRPPTDLGISMQSECITGLHLYLCVQNGAGDFIGGMKFCPTDFSRIYAASGEGTLTLHSFEGHTPTLLSRTQDCGHDHHSVCFWYCCVDVSVSRQMLVTGDNMGELLLVGLDGKKIFSSKLHKAKVTHAEFNSRCDWLLATASVDHTVKLWDLRNIKDKTSFLYEMPHERAVNSAYFNPLDATKLLTTDQHDQIRVYSSSDWSKPQHIIQHPHRQFQHLTPIKATWHPLYDLIVAGRYPDDRICTGDQRTIDVFDSNSGELVFQMYDSTASGIKSINKFSPMGDVIGSGMGVTLLIWDHDESLVSGRHKPIEETSASADGVRGQRRGQQRSGRDRRGSTRDAKLKKKLASMEETETKTKTGCTKQKQTRKRKL